MSEVLVRREAEKQGKAVESGDEGGNAGEFRSKLDPGLEMPRPFDMQLDRGEGAVTEQILQLLAAGPMKPAAIRRAVGIKSRVYFTRFYLAPLLKGGLIARVDPEHPRSPQQMYMLA